MAHAIWNDFAQDDDLIFQASERKLLAAAKAGGREAAEELVERTYNTIYASLYRLCGGDAELAADLTQDTYRKAWEALAGFDGRSKLSTWLYRIAYTTFLNHVRRPNRTTPLDESKPVSDPSPSIIERLSSDQEKERLREAVLTLPEDLRFTVTARFWGGLEVSDIAREEKVTTVAIRKRLKKAFALLESTLEKEL